KVTHYKLKLPKASLSPGADLPKELVFTPLDEHFLAIALDREALGDAVAKKEGKKADVQKEIVELIGKINPKETLSFVVVPPQEQLAGGPADGLKTVTGGVIVSDGVKTDILLATKDADTAKTLAQLINEGL